MNWTLEVVTVPVSDVDRAKRFYSERVGFAVDHDTREVSEVKVASPSGFRPSREEDVLDNVGFIFLGTRTATAGPCSRYLPAPSLAVRA